MKQIQTLLGAIVGLLAFIGTLVFAIVQGVPSLQMLFVEPYTFKQLAPVSSAPLLPTATFVPVRVSDNTPTPVPSPTPSPTSTPLPTATPSPTATPDPLMTPTQPQVGIPSFPELGFKLEQDPTTGIIAASYCDPALFPSLASDDRTRFDLANARTMSSNVEIDVRLEFVLNRTQSIIFEGDGVLNNFNRGLGFEINMLVNTINTPNQATDLPISIRFVEGVFYQGSASPDDPTNIQWRAAKMGDILGTYVGQSDATVQNQVVNTIENSANLPEFRISEYVFTTNRASSGDRVEYESCFDLFRVLTDIENTDMLVQLVGEDTFKQLMFPDDNTGMPVVTMVNQTVGFLLQLARQPSWRVFHTVNLTEQRIERFEFNIGTSLLIPDNTTGAVNVLPIELKGRIALKNYNTNRVALAPTENVRQMTTEEMLGQLDVVAPDGG